MTRSGCHRIRAAGLGAAIACLLALPAAADDNFPGPGSYGDRLTPQSSWEEILKTPGVRPDFPQLNFGKEYVPLTAVCVEGAMLRIADPRLDNGVRLPVAQVVGREGTSAAPSGYAAERADPFSVRPVALAAGQPQGGPDRPPHAVVGVPVNVDKSNSWVTGSRVTIFHKVWEIPACSGA